MKGRNQTIIEPMETTYWQDIYDIKDVLLSNDFITGQEVHVWLAPIDTGINFYNNLSPEEKVQVSKFRLYRDQHRYIVSHGILRQILGTYHKEDPATLKLKKTRYGKPFIDSNNGGNAIQFNMSHSENVACYVISAKYEVGIDVEYVNPDFQWLSIAKVYFSQSELVHLESLPKKDQAKAFFATWTKKEALLKAVGTGLNDIDDLVRNDSNSKFNEYAIRVFNYGDHYLGAFAGSSNISNVRYFRYIT